MANENVYRDPSWQPGHVLIEGVNYESLVEPKPNPGIFLLKLGKDPVKARIEDSLASLLESPDLFEPIRDDYSTARA